MKHPLRSLREFFFPAPAVELPDLVLPPDVPRETSVTYEELMARRQAYDALRNRIDICLTAVEVGPPADVDMDERTGDLLVTSTYDGVVRTHRLIFKEEPRNVPRETSKEE